jgi:hypothetical protein
MGVLRSDDVIQPTPLEQLRRPHPDQVRIDREAAELLRRTALPDSVLRAAPYFMDRKPMGAAKVQPPST